MENLTDSDLLIAHGLGTRKGFIAGVVVGAGATLAAKKVKTEFLKRRNAKTSEK